MTTTTTALSAFLLREIESDEAVARATSSKGAGWLNGAVPDEIAYVYGRSGNHSWTVADSDYEPDSLHIARHDPARVLADCAARRAIVEQSVAWEQVEPRDERAIGGINALRVSLRHLVQPYRDRPGYDPAWDVS